MSQQHISDTAKQSRSSFPALGENQGRRSAEIMATLRATLRPDPMTKALASSMGTSFMRFISHFSRSSLEEGGGYVAARDVIYRHLVSTFLASYPHPTPVIVDIASGLSPIGLLLAQDNPNAKVIEIDLPEVIATKRERIEQSTFSLPANWAAIEADLGVKPLNDLLDESVDVIYAAGLHPYFTPDVVTQIIAGVHTMLKPGGLYLSDMGRDLIGQLEGNAVRIFERQAGRIHCKVDTEEEARAFYAQFGEVRIHDSLEAYKALEDKISDFIPFTYVVEAIKAPEAAEGEPVGS